MPSADLLMTSSSSGAGDWAAGLNRVQFVALAMTVFAWACVIGQCFIELEYVNVLASAETSISITVLALYLALSRPFDDAPVSSLALVGFCVSAQAAALVAQTVHGDPFVAHLRAPELTFKVLLAVQCLAIATHYVHRRFQPIHSLQQSIARNLLSPLGVHDVPGPFVLWTMGAVGGASMLMGGAESGNALGKLLQACDFMTWAPFLILVYRKHFGSRYCDIFKHLPFIGLFLLGIVLLAVSRNIRQFMFVGPVTALLVYFLISVRQHGLMGRENFVRIISGFALGAVTIVLVADLATAMTVVRDKRADVTPREMVEETFHAMLDRNRLAAYRERQYLSTLIELYDEAYLSNPVLGRLSETKFHDNMLYFADRFDGEQVEEIMETLVGKVIVLLPQPALDFLGLKIKKYEYLYSMGDMYAFQANGGFLGGYYTGSIWADLYALGGAYFPLLVCVLSLIAFIVLDVLTRLDGDFFISPVAFCAAWVIFLYGLGGESVAHKMQFVLRDFPQKILLFVLLLAPLKFFWPNVVYRPANVAASDNPGRRE
jgi:hypothetical protein